MKIAVLAGDENGPTRMILPYMEYSSLDEAEHRASGLKGMPHGWFPVGTIVEGGIPHLYLAEGTKVVSSSSVYMVANSWKRPPNAQA